MENNERDRKLDQWLDEALSQYSAAEPRLGLEQRVLAHISAEQKARAGQKNWWRWMPAFAAIAAILIVAVAVRPYWETKSAPTKRAGEAASIAPQKSVNDEAADGSAVKEKSTETRKNAQPKHQVQPQMARRDTTLSTAEADKQVVTKKDGLVVSAQPRPERESSGLASSNEALQAKGAAVADLKSKAVPLNPKQSMNYFALPATVGPDTPAVGRANEPVSGGVIANGKAVVARPSKDPRTEIISVDGPHPVVQVQDQTVEVTTAAERVTAVPEPTGAMRAMKVHANPKGPLAKKLEENVESGYSAGLVAGKELKKANANSAKQFPSPAPLTKEEQQILSAAKSLNNVDASQEKQKTESDSSAVEIKKIEIAPLPGPPK